MSSYFLARRYEKITENKYFNYMFVFLKRQLDQLIVISELNQLILF